MRPSLALTLAITIIATPVLARDARHIPEAIPAGPALSCIPLSGIRTSHVRNDQIIDFAMSGGKTYRNTLPTACPGLGFQESFSYETSLSQLCSTDIVTVIYTSPPMRGASCGLGSFQPVTLSR